MGKYTGAAGAMLDHRYGASYGFSTGPSYNHLGEAVADDMFGGLEERAARQRAAATASQETLLPAEERLVKKYMRQTKRSLKKLGRKTAKALKQMPTVEEEADAVVEAVEVAELVDPDELPADPLTRRITRLEGRLNRLRQKEAVAHLTPKERREVRNALAELDDLHDDFDALEEGLEEATFNFRDVNYFASQA